MTFVSNSEAGTEALGRRLGELAFPGMVLCLSGPLGAGKTALVRGLAGGLGIDEERVHSPTFVTAIEYRGRWSLAHVDLYRHEETLPPPDWLAEMLEGDGVAAVEWSERLGADAPADAIRIDLAYGEAPDERRFELSATGSRSARALAALEGPGSDTAQSGPRLVQEGVCAR